MRKTDKIYIALLLFVVAAGIGTWEYHNPRIDTFRPDGGYIDTMLQDHSRLVPITSDTATPETSYSDTSYNPKTDFGAAVKAQEAVDSAYRQ